MPADSHTESYKIGEAARLAGVNRETVRYYGRRKLISEPDRMKSGYRIYNEQHIRQIRFIKSAQELGFTLSEIKELLSLQLDGTEPCSKIRKKAVEKYSRIEEKIDQLLKMKNTLGDLIDQCDAGGTTENCVILNAIEGNYKK